MLKQNNQLEMSFSKHIELYDLLIDKDNFWKQMSDIIDFSFVYDYLTNKSKNSLTSSSSGMNLDLLI